MNKICGIFNHQMNETTINILFVQDDVSVATSSSSGVTLQGSLSICDNRSVVLNK